ncbi:FkbM family methyltransferase [Rhizobium ruizarguesonis]|uniref:FkbM family methyltransferase n=1 Tax=Rhizobium ruizarguesonis TaxID=2081791 RepID=A0AAE8Q963_9HYPH|nr:FkbM family methyltransferase [Rhizobium ruizarguesonis]TAV04249.1 FkbM family methyltransferase [Rhizobium ruizarguesonis]TBA79190.1 FkbM family methyltransferase [Rhizobium ruizarguesonis]TBA83969.1 FkbM family methyltransferase [Rhizobium ruizarguesonis]TBB10094.1 FkbM family methyltransferase [Rhizobium ruizarguesonis]TBB20774.1 FkbM family methyltransferase [Rhizobium ruizarguesonis]
MPNYVVKILNKWQNRFRLLKSYISFTYPLVRYRRDLFTPQDALRYFPRWIQSKESGKGSLADELPWMAYPAIDYLSSFLEKSHKVFEYGAGGSSVYFIRRVAELISVEHDERWFEETRNIVTNLSAELKVTWKGFFAPPKHTGKPTITDPSDPLSYASSDAAYAGMTFEDYCSAIDSYPNEYFDVILIDGRARPGCFLHCMNKVKFNGYIVLDNAERETYAYIERTAQTFGFEVKEFWGPGPYNDYPWRTIFLQRKRQYFGLEELDRKLEKYLNYEGGFFVEAGGNDGVRQSNTLYYEMRRGWRGLLVEAVPELYEECRRNRPSAQVVWGALTDSTEVPGTITIRYAGLMSVAKGGMKSDQEELAHVEAGCTVQRLDTYEVEVPCRTLADIIEEYKLPQIHLLSLDIEGMELKALKGLNLAINKPLYILVEVRYREEVEKELGDQYEFVAQLSHHDILFGLKQT